MEYPLELLEIDRDKDQSLSNCKYSIIEYVVADTPHLRVFAVMIPLFNHVLIRLALFLDELYQLHCTCVVKAALEKDTVFRQVVLVKPLQFFVEEVVLHYKIVVADITALEVCFEAGLS